VQGMMDIENEFADIWTSELEYSIETFTALLNEDDKAEFKLIQKNWEQNLTNSRTFLDEIFNNDEYQVYTGRMFLVEEAAEYKNEIRRRTLYVKYLQFNMEQSEDFIVNFEWNNTVQ
jgi:DICT domain-containing protein